MVSRHVMLALVLAAAGCLEADVRRCTTGVLCAGDKVCSPDGSRCVLQEQIVACTDHPAGAPCTFRGSTGSCENATCVANTCGDQVIQVEADEDCEPGLPLDVTCQQFGFYDAVAVTCGDDCRFDLSACVTAGFCGDELLNGPEDCEATLALEHTCLDAGYYAEGALACGKFCTFDTSGCSQFCGDAIINGPEDCDLASVVDTTCVDLGFGRGTVGCATTCDLAPACDVFGWREIATLEGELFDIVEVSPSQRHAVGKLGLFHDDGTGWRQRPELESYTFRAIWAASPTDIYAVGDRGVVAHFDGTSWSPISIGANADLGDVSGTAGDDIFIVGTGAIFHCSQNNCSQGSAGWTKQMVVPEEDTPMALFILNAVHAYDHDNVFAAGAYCPGGFVACFTSLLRYNRTDQTWSEFRGALVEASVPRYTIWGAPDNLYISLSSIFGGLYQFNGTLTQVPGSPPATAIWGTSASDVFLSAPGGTLRHWDGVRWWTIESTAAETVNSVIVAIGRPLGVTASGKVIEFRSGGWTVPIGLPFTPELAGAQTTALAVGRGKTLSFDGSSWIELPSTDAIEAASLVSPTDGFGVGPNGPNGNLYRFDGVASPPRWIPMTSPTTEWLGGVWAGSSTTAMAIKGGDVTAVAAVRYDGAAWTNATQGLTANLLAVFGRSATEVYALRYSYVSLWNGSTWSVVQTAPGSRHAVWVAATGEVFAVGEPGQLTSKTGTTWTESTLPTAERLYALYGTSRDDIWAGGTNGTLLHYNGTTWAVTKLPTSATITDLWGSTERGYIAATVDGFLWHFDGAAWQRIESGTFADLRAVATLPDGTRVAVGDGGVIVKNASYWQPAASPTASALHAINALGTELVAVGDGGTVLLSSDTTTWQPLSSGTSVSLRGITATTTGAVIVGDGGTVLRYNRSLGSFVPLAAPTTASLRGAWVSTGITPEVFVVGDAGTLLRHDGAQWHGYAATAVDLTSVWGTSATDVYAVGAGGTILHFDGTTWTAERSLTTANLTAVRGAGATDVFATGRAGVLLHRSAMGWGPVAMPITRDVFGIDITGRSGTVVGAHGETRTLFRVGDW